jgi:hypothetical protein
MIKKMQEEKLLNNREKPVADAQKTTDTLKKKLNQLRKDNTNK